MRLGFLVHSVYLDELEVGVKGLLDNSAVSFGGQDSDALDGLGGLAELHKVHFCPVDILSG